MKDQNILYLFVLLVILYVALTLLTPTDPAVLARYDLTQDKARLLSLTIILPIIAIWFTGFYGFSRIKQYAQSIIETKGGGYESNRQRYHDPSTRFAGCFQCFS